METDGPREVVLVGGGHAHVQVLRVFAETPLPDSRLTVVVDTPIGRWGPRTCLAAAVVWAEAGPIGGTGDRDLGGWV